MVVADSEMTVQFVDWFETCPFEIQIEWQRPVEPSSKAVFEKEVDAVLKLCPHTHSPRRRLLSRRVFERVYPQLSAAFGHRVKWSFTTRWVLERNFLGTNAGLYEAQFDCLDPNQPACFSERSSIVKLRSNRNFCPEYLPLYLDLMRRSILSNGLVACCAQTVADRLLGQTEQRESSDSDGICARERRSTHRPWEERRSSVLEGLPEELQQEIALRCNPIRINL